MVKPLILLSNDDGVHAHGINVLREALMTVGEVYLVAPDVEKSASSHAITTHNPLRYKKLGDQIYAVNGTPADSVHLGLRQIVPRKPDWVISGINHGANLGHDTLYSGTVGAALEGAIQGIKSLAVSLYMLDEKENHFMSAVHYTLKLIEKATSFMEGRSGALNLNVPNLPLSQIKDLKVATLGRRIYEDGFVEGMDPRGGRLFWLGAGGRAFEDIPGSDCNYIDQNFATVSFLHASLLDENTTQKLDGFIHG